MAQDDCCPTASVVKTSYAHQPLLLGACCVSQAAFNVQAGQTFQRAELVKLNTASPGTIEKLTVAPVAGDIVAIVVYDADNTTTAVAAGLATTRATVYVDGTFNELELIYPAGVTADQIRVLMASKGFILKKPLVIA
jgi:hypothetical protein